VAGYCCLRDWMGDSGRPSGSCRFDVRPSVESPDLIDQPFAINNLIPYSPWLGGSILIVPEKLIWNCFQEMPFVDFHGMGISTMLL
jgi:hypothetical protein